MNIWFKNSSTRNRRDLAGSFASSMNTQLPIIKEQHLRMEDHDEQSAADEDFYQVNKHNINNSSKEGHPLSSSTFGQGSNGYHYRQEQRNVPRSKRELTRTNKSVKFEENAYKNVQKSFRNVQARIERSNSLLRSTQSHYGGAIQEVSQVQQQQDDERQDQNDGYVAFVPLKTQNKGISHIQSHIYNDDSKRLHEQSKRSISPLNTIKQSTKDRAPSILRESSSILRQTSSIAPIPKTGRSVSSLNMNYEPSAGKQQNWHLNSKGSQRNSLQKTTGRRANIKQHIISIIEYCSNEVGMAIYNTVNGEIFLCQIIERLTYFRTISTIQRFYPLEIIYSSSLQHRPLMKKIGEHFRATTLRNFRRLIFDETKGYNIYNQRGNKEEYNPDNKFIAYSALSALIFYLQNSYETKFNYSSLKVRWHLLEDLLIIESQTIFSLEVFLNAETKEKENCFISNFVCLTHGGNRMLRANMLQPLSNEQAIKSRYDLVQVLLDDRILFDILSKELMKFRNFEIITAKFIQNPKEKNIKSLKTYLSAIYSISHMCLLLKNLYKKIEQYIPKKLPVINKLFVLLNDPKIGQLKDNIQSNFDEEILRSYEGGKTGKKENFIFLFKMEKMDDEFIQVMRITYSHTMEDILRVFKAIKDRSSLDLKLIYNQFRGYYIKYNKKINLSELSQKIQDDIIQISEKKDSVNFSTSILVSLNNRLKQTQKKIILLSEGLLCNIISDIQKSIDILFDINYEISLIDMIMSFASFVKKYNAITFCRPVIQKDCEGFKVEGLKTVWTNESKYRISNDVRLELDNKKKILVIQKDANSFQQLNLLYSIGYLTILSQIGCFVPAVSYKTGIFHTLLSKIQLTQSIQSNLSHFQLQLYHFKNILDNILHKNANCLILLNQAVKGTQYEQQVALSLSILNQLSKVSGKSFILISDIFLINTIQKLQQLSKKQSNIDEELLLTSVQVLSSNLKSDITKVLQQYNFDDDYIRIFNRLSVDKDHSSIYK